MLLYRTSSVIYKSLHAILWGSNIALCILFMVHPQTKSFMWDLQAHQAQCTRKVWFQKRDYMDVRLTLVVMHSNIWRQSSPLFCILSLGNIHGVYFVLATSLVLPGHWTKTTAIMQRCPSSWSSEFTGSHMVCEFCEQYCQDATRGFPGYWKIRKIFHTLHGYLLTKECIHCVHLIFWGSMLPDLECSLLHTQQTASHPPFSSSVSGSAHDNHSHSLTPEALPPWQLCFPLRNAIKTSCLQEVVYNYLSLSFPAL